ncbi:hypothetical protein BU17DRAFT_71739 [Hysterangium stoloniferum]|nr:hypothetical protein BU17DRAFT_71739 [Hysterangium stoloniferum]
MSGKILRKSGGICDKIGVTQLSFCHEELNHAAITETKFTNNLFEPQLSLQHCFPNPILWTIKAKHTLTFDPKTSYSYGSILVLAYRLTCDVESIATLFVEVGPKKARIYVLISVRDDRDVGTSMNFRALLVKTILATDMSAKETQELESTRQYQMFCRDHLDTKDLKAIAQGRVDFMEACTLTLLEVKYCTMCPPDMTTDVPIISSGRGVHSKH